MNTRRNVGIIGAPDSGISDVYKALLRLSYTPYVDDNPNGVATADTIDWGEYYGDSEQSPYNAKKRKKLFEE